MISVNNSDSSISQIKSKFDCIDILGRFGVKAKTGANIICPIHRPQETRPSFNVYGDGQKFKCFSCGASGDCINLFALLAGVDAGQAIKQLGGHEIKRGRPVPKPQVRREPLKLKVDFKTIIADYDSVNYNGLLAELWEMSSFRPGTPTAYIQSCEAVALLNALYCPDEYIYIGGQYDAKKRDRVKQRNDWVRTIEAEDVKYPFFCLNPVSPDGSVNSNGEISFRTSRNIIQHKYTLFENDKVDLRDQAAFWIKMILYDFPVKALIFSGRKSIHAIAETESREIDVLKSIFTDLGFDEQTYDPARTARLPGHWREDSLAFQSIIYLR